ncbi:MAG: hypothetical protein H7062_16855, partial [Candidatus Saccharimonas sp.]|nr:hypothetical protein [Planctomycetaceae bacterium]
MIFARFLLAFVTAVMAAVAFFPALSLSRSKRRAILLAVDVPILLSPLWIPAEVPLARFLAMLIAIALFVKLYDLHVAADREPRPTWRTFIAWLPNLSSIVLRKLDREPRPARSTNLRRLAWGSVGFVPGCVLLIVLSRIDWSGLPFLVEHSAKVLALFLTLVPAMSALVSILRLMGARARDPMDNPFAARTPADFWRRYNRPTQQFFYEDIFKPAGGLRSPIRATLITFAVSAVIHEYVFSIVIGRVEGYQTA